MTTVRLIRRNKGQYLDVVGVTCRLKKQNGKPCGGALQVRDWQDRGDFRYELFCSVCQTSDPNGWSTQREVIESGIEYFSGQE